MFKTAITVFFLFFGAKVSAQTADIDWNAVKDKTMSVVRSSAGSACSSASVLSDRAKMDSAKADVLSAVAEYTPEALGKKEVTAQAVTHRGLSIAAKVSGFMLSSGCLVK